MGDALHRVVLAVRPVIQGIDLPFVSRAVVRRLMDDAIHHRVAHVEVGMSHIDLGAQDA